MFACMQGKYQVSVEAGIDSFPLPTGGYAVSVNDPVEFGCDYCRDDQNRWYGHVTQIGSSEERRTLLLRCPRCGALYENTPEGPDQTRRLSEADAGRLFPDVELTQTTPAGEEIPVPTREEFDEFVRKVAPPAGRKRPAETDQPPEQSD
jgi:hypothetical protein